MEDPSVSRRLPALFPHDLQFCTQSRQSVVDPLNGKVIHGLLGGDIIFHDGFVVGKQVIATVFGVRTGVLRKSTRAENRAP